MNLSAIAVRRPILSVMATVAILVLGGLGLARIGVDLFPDVTFPVVSVTVPYPGASPGEVESLVTKEVEDAVVTLNDLDRVRSFSTEGVSRTVVVFKLKVNLEDAATRVRERVAGIRYKLPRDVKEPIVGRFDASANPILTYTLRGTGSLSQSRKLADDVLRPALEQVDGVAAVRVSGGAAREVHVELDPVRLAALGLSPAAVAARLRASNLNVPGGHFDEGRREISVRTIGELKSVEAVREVIIATAQDGSSVRLRDVARVEDAFEEKRTRARLSGEEAVALDVLKQSGKNTVAVSDAVKARVAELTAQLPEGTRLAIVIDQAATHIKPELRRVAHDLLFGALMAVLTILVFMRDLRSTLISAIAIPVSILGTFFVLYLLGFTLNMMTLLGLSLAVGLLIDDAVVVRENIFKHLERGKPPMQAALDGTKEITLSVLATTLTVVAVFMPVAFVGGTVGQFFREFGVTISVAVALSLFVAFTVDPMISSRLSRQLGATRPSRLSRLTRPLEDFFAGLTTSYSAALGWATRHQALVGLTTVGSLAVSGWVGGMVGNDFLASEDRGSFVVDLELPAGTPLAETARLTLAAERRVARTAEVRDVFATLGPDGEVNKARWRVVTTPKVERSIPLSDLKEAARAAASTVPGATVIVTDPPILEGVATEVPIMIDVQGPSYDEITPVASEIARILGGTAGVHDVQVKFTPGRPELHVSLDRARVADLGLEVGEVAAAVRTAMQGDEAGLLRQGKDEVPIRVRLDEAHRSDESSLADLTLATPRGLVKLADVAHLSRGSAPQVIEREARSRQIQVWAVPSRPLGDLVAELQPKLAALKLPPGARIAYDGQIKMMSESNSSMALAFVLGWIFIYLVLASQFESFVHPLTIMLSLPLAFVGAINGLFLAGKPVQMGAVIGIIFLMGLVAKNAILLIDRAVVRVREHGQTPLEAILAAGPERLRPILMTSAAMVAGMLPAALARSEGSEFRAPMATAIVGGIVSSTLLSLVVVPVFYLAVEALKARLASVRRRPVRQPPGAGPAVAPAAE
jgi:hydrophobe/amphiphile efflux-1 (HAE1) family protein